MCKVWMFCCYWWCFLLRKAWEKDEVVVVLELVMLVLCLVMRFSSMNFLIF